MSRDLAGDANAIFQDSVDSSAAAFNSVLACATSMQARAHSYQSCFLCGAVLFCAVQTANMMTLTMAQNVSIQTV
jgi:hypothetical protein